MEPNPFGTSPDVEIDIASDIVCPWCAVGWKQLEHALAETGVAAAVRWHPFELNPDMPPEGEALRDHVARKYGSTAAQSEKARARLTALGADLGFQFVFRERMRIVNTFDAHRLLAWAGEKGEKHRLKLVLLHAYFTDGRDVSDAGTLAAIAAGCGLAETEALGVLASDRYGAAVRSAERDWAELGVDGVPAMLFNRRHLVVGARGTETYAQILLYLSGRTVPNLGGSRSEDPS